MNQNFLGTKAAAEFLGVSKTTLLRRVMDGTAPAPIRLGGKGHMKWPADEIEAWLAESRYREKVTP
jgi:excisionase family DNA binding protein